MLTRLTHFISLTESSEHIHALRTASPDLVNRRIFRLVLSKPHFPGRKGTGRPKTTLEQEAAILEKAVIQSRKKLDDAQDATRAAEEDIERFQQAYLQQKRQQHQEIQDAAYQKSVADQQEEVKEHDQKIDRLRRRMKRQRESTKSAREELLRKRRE